MPFLPFGEYRPDVADYEGQYSQRVSGVVPRGDGYGPFKSLQTFTDPLSNTCRGLFFAKKLDGTVYIFAGVIDRLALLNNSTMAWTEVSKGSSDYPALAANANWTFAQFNNLVFATHANVPLQVFNLASSSEFADCAGDPPQAAYVSVVNRFLVLSGIADDTTRVQWSALNDTTGWDAGEDQSDYQDLPDGGTTRGVAGGEFGVIFQDSSIRRMTYAPGSDFIFSLDRISIGDGLYAPYSLVTAGDRIFFLSPQGFKMLLPGGYPTPIGKERFDRTFFNDLDATNLQLVIGASDPQQTKVYWAYKSVDSGSAVFDKILVYDYILDRATVVPCTGQYLATIARSGVTLEQVDTVFGNDLDALTISFDDIVGADTPALAAMNSDRELGLFNGDNIEAFMDTPDHGNNDRRYFIRGFRPVTDATSLLGSVSTRDTPQQNHTLSNEVALNSIGICNFHKSTRYARARIRIPASSTWTYASGVEPIIAGEGQR